MPTYEHAPFLVLDEAGRPAPGAVGNFYAREDTTFSLPLEITDTGGVSIPSVTANDLGVCGAFKTDRIVVVFKSGSLPPFEMVSTQGILELLTEQTEITEQVLEDLQTYVAENPSALPAEGRTSGRVLSLDSALEPMWQDPTVGASGDWSTISNKPELFPAASHTHQASQVSDSTTVGRALLTASDAAAARAAIGAGTGSGTSNLTLGTTGSTAAPGNHSHGAGAVTFTPSGPITATDVQGAIVQAAALGGGGSATMPAGNVIEIKYSGSSYPVRGTQPTGTVVYWVGPVQPTIGGQYAVAGTDRWLVTA